MSALVIIMVLAAIVVAVAAALGAGILVLIVVPIAIIGVGWLLFLGASRMRAGDVIRRTPRQEFLGPGGPDDPDA